jgi:hypothetical protein
MAGIKLGKLPDRTPVKLTISVSPDLKKALDDYCALYGEIYRQQESIPNLIPAMLAAFLDSDREFKRRKAIKPGTT